MEGTPNSKPPHLSVFARAFKFAIVPVTAAVFHFAYCILLVQAHTFNVVERTGHRRFSSVSLTMSTEKLVPSRSVGFRTSTWPLSRVVFARASPLFRSAQLCFICVCYCTGKGVRSQRSKIGPKISQISRYIGQIRWRFEIDRPKGLKEAGRCRSVRKLLFPFAGARAK